MTDANPESPYRIPSSPTPSDQELLRRFAADADQDAFRELVGRHGPSVWVACRRALRGRQDAEDAFQATFLALVQNARSIRHRGSFRGWLTAVARRVAMRALRSRYRRQAALRRLVGLRGSAPDPGPSASEELWAILDEELGALPEIQGDVVRRCLLEGQSYREVSEELAIPIATVASHVRRGRRRLGERLIARGIRGVVVASAGSLAVRAARGPSARVCAATAENARLLLAGGPTALPPRVVSLMKGAAGNMAIATRLVLGLALLAGVGTTALRSTDDRDPRGGRGAGAIVARCAPGSSLDVTAFWEPIAWSRYGFHQAWKELADFGPAEAVHRYAGRDFAALLPDGAVGLGETWPIGAEGAAAFLRQFHPGATGRLHIDNGDSPEGGRAILSAYNERLALIHVRLHGEFVLEEGWLTPGRFQGTILLDRETGQVRFFRLSVPSAAVNFDANWRITDGEVGGVAITPENAPIATDAGVLPRMELRGGDEGALSGQAWSGSIPEAEALDLLERALYPFRKVDWVAFDRAASLARETGKPLHVVAVDGFPCDESCCGSGKALRAGPLSDDRVASLLNGGCVNTWVVNGSLPGLRDSGPTEDVRALARAVLGARQPGSPVDSMVFTPSLGLVSVQAAHGILLGTPGAGASARYEGFLREALERSRAGGGGR